MFEDDPSVLYVSLHRYPFYPMTGSFKETGVGAGRGYNVSSLRQSTPILSFESRMCRFLSLTGALSSFFLSALSLLNCLSLSNLSFVRCGIAAVASLALRFR